MTSGDLTFPDGMDLEQVLSRLAAGDPAVEPFAYDDLRLAGPYPIEWEHTVINASQRKQVHFRWGYLELCAQLLVGMGSKWTGLSQLLLELLQIRADLTVWSLIDKYLTHDTQAVSREFAVQVLDRFRNLPVFYRLLLFLDGPTRHVLAVCRRAA